MKHLPRLPFSHLFNLSFGFFGVQIAYALQSANISRIFSTLGADPHNLSYFWILPPLMGILVQPIIGVLSDRTWTRFGRRIPYLFVGALIAVLVMCLLPNAGSFGMSVGSGYDFRVDFSHVSRHEYQHCYATLQNDGGRHGERRTKINGLLHSIVPLQCR